MTAHEACRPFHILRVGGRGIIFIVGVCTLLYASPGCLPTLGPLPALACGYRIAAMVIVVIGRYAAVGACSQIIGPVAVATSVITLVARCISVGRTRRPTALRRRCVAGEIVVVEIYLTATPGGTPRIIIEIVAHLYRLIIANCIASYIPDNAG